MIKQSDVTVTVSGTASLEVALLNVPQMVVYKTSFLTYLIAKMVVKVKYISLVNLIADREVVRELIQEDLTVSNMVNELNVKEKNILIRYSSIDAIIFIILCNVTQQCYKAVLSQLNFILTRYCKTFILYRDICFLIFLANDDYYVYKLSLIHI